MDDLIVEFISETAESLAVLDAELVKLERNPGDREILGTIYRLVHTIKGTCGFLELPRLEAVAEAVEQVLAKVHGGNIIMAQSTSFVLLEALSSIRHIVSHLADSGCEPEGNDHPLVARLRHIASGGHAGDQKATEPAPKPTLVEKTPEFAEPEKQPSLPPMAMNHPPLATIEPPKHEGETLSAQAKQRAIQHGLEVPTPATATLPRNLLEKLAGALVDLINARNLLKAVKTAEAPLKRLNAATTALKEVLAIAEQETAQPTQVKFLSVLVAYAAGHALALPQRYIMEVVDLFVDRGVRVETINNTQVLIKGKRVIPLVKLRSLLKLSEFPSMREDQVVVMRVGEAEFGLVIERVGELMEVVVEKLPRALRPLAIYQGTALANDEKLVMVMDTAGLARAIGFRQVQDIPPATAPQQTDRSLQGFLVFRAGKGVLKALLVDQVARIDEAASRAPDIRIATLPGTELPATGEYELVVLETGGEQVAIAVEKVLDVMHAPLTLKPHGNNPAYLGTVELGTMTVELVNVANVIGARLMEAA